jgi:peptidoglycan DL-endopeptidase CwlO
MRAAMTRASAGMRDVRVEAQQATTALDRQRGAVDRAGSAWTRLRRSISDVNRSFAFTRNIIGLIRFPALIVAVGLAAQAIAALTAGAVALGASLGPLVGLVAALPAGLAALAGPIGAVKLAFTDLKEALDGNAEAIKRLTPEARRFGAVLNGLKPLVRDLRREAQRGLFPGLEAGLRSALTVANVATARRAIRGGAAAVGAAAAAAGATLATPQVQEQLASIVERNNALLQRMAALVPGITRSFITLIDTAGPLLERMAGLIERFVGWLDRAIERGRESGTLSRFFRESGDVLDVVVDLLVDLGAALINIGRIAYRVIGQQMLRDLGNVVQRFRDFTESVTGQDALADYFRRARGPIYETAALIRDLTGVFFRLGAQPGTEQLIFQFREQLLPALERLLIVTQREFGPVLIDALTQFVYLLTQLAGASGPLTNFVRVLGDVAGGVARFLEHNPRIRDMITNIIGVIAVAKAISFASAIIGVTRLLRFMGLIGPAAVAAQGEVVAASTVMAGGQGIGRVRRAVLLLNLAFRRILPIAIALFVADAMVNFDRLEKKIIETFDIDWGPLEGLDKFVDAQLQKSGLDYARAFWGKIVGQSSKAGESAGAQFLTAFSRYQPQLTIPAAVRGRPAPTIAETAGILATVAPGARAVPQRGAARVRMGVIRGATEQLGQRYVWGGESRAEGGFDCSGLIYQAYKRMGIDIPRTSQTMWRAGQPVPSLAEAQPGDVIIANQGRHAVLYIGNGQVIAASSSAGRVVIQPVSVHRIVGIRRFIGRAVDASAIDAYARARAGAAPPAAPPAPGAAFPIQPVPLRPTPTAVTRAAIDETERVTAAERRPVARALEFATRRIDRTLERFRDGLRKRAQELRKALKEATTDEELREVERKIKVFADRVTRNINVSRAIPGLRRQLATIRDQIAALPASVRPRLQRQMQAIQRQLGTVMTPEGIARIRRQMQNLREAIEEEIEKLKQRVEEAMQGVRDAFQTVLDRALEVFDAQTEALAQAARAPWEAAGPAELALEAFRQQREAEQLQDRWDELAKRREDALRDHQERMEDIAERRVGAEERLSVAMRLQDPTLIREANQEIEDLNEEAADSQQTYMDALAQIAEDEAELRLDIKEKELQDLADAERKYRDDQADIAERAVRDQRRFARDEMQARLNEVIDGFLRQEITYEEAMQRIGGILGQYGVTFAAAGALLGGYFRIAFENELNRLWQSFQNFVNAVNAQRAALGEAPLPVGVLPQTPEINAILDKIARGEPITDAERAVLAGYQEPIQAQPTYPVFSGGAGGRVQTLQRGGIVTRPTLAMLGERRRREAVIPLEDARAQALLSRVGMGGETTINVGTLVGTTRTDLERVINRLHDRQRRRGDYRGILSTLR